MTFDVKIFLPDGEIVRGIISYTTEGPRLIDTNNCPIDAAGKSIEFSIIDIRTNESASISEQDRVTFDALTYYRKLIPSHPGRQDHYPPSSQGWIRYLSKNGISVRIDLQRINNGDRYLLCCVDIENNKILRFHTIKSYETNILRMETDWDHYNRVYVDSNDEEISLEKLLEAPTPPWPNLELLLKGIEIHNLRRYETIGETLSQLIPTSFPEDVRKELMVFLAWTLKASIPQEDPLDFLNAINRRFKSGPRLMNLIFGHVQCLIQDIPIPEYVRIFNLAEKGSLSMGILAQTDVSEQESWSKAWYRLTEMFPKHNIRIMDLVNQLNLDQEIHTRLPITKEMAAASKEAWLSRFALIRSNFSMRGYFQDRKIGLEKMVYIGAAHRWPHKHLQYAARLGHPDQKPPYIQVMLMPKTAVDRISRVKHNILPIDWTASRVNFNLYNAHNDTWRYNAAHFKKSFNNLRTKQQLDKEFEQPSSLEIIPFDEQDIKLFDLLADGLHQHSFEIGGYEDILNPLTNQEIHEKIEFYKREKIVHLQYLPTTSGRVSVCFDIRGPIKKLYSISRAALKHLPTATVMLSSSNEVGIIMARVPEIDAYHILTDLPAEVKDYDISMKAYRVFAYAGYVHNLYQRLRTPEGTWNDDTSGLLSQITN